MHRETIRRLAAESFARHELRYLGRHRQLGIGSSYAAAFADADVHATERDHEERDHESPKTPEE